ncbi:MAG: hypothetical protein J6Q20_03010 [Alistipes sp.]|nr:hypothetical protein [Alistipes sp.]
MKRIALWAVALLTILGLQSCNKDNFGYERQVEFTAEGGTKSVTGTESIYELSIANYNGNEEWDDDELDGNESVMTVHFDWLSAVATRHTKTIVITAEPNKTGKRRVLYIYGEVRDRSSCIKVIQDK